MKIKFNLFERVAGLFVLGAVAMAFMVTIGMGIKKGWFEPKMALKIEIESADGINPGTPVSFSGIRIGAVDSVDLVNSNRVVIKFKVIKRFAERINSNSVVNVVRPFVIGEKALEITDGDVEGLPIKEGQLLTSNYSPDFLEFLGGNKFGAYMQNLDNTMQNLHKLAEAFLSNERSDKIIELFDQMIPLMDRMNSMASEVSLLSASLNDQKKLVRVLDDVRKISSHLNKALPAVSEDMPELSGNILKLTKNLNKLSTDMNQLVPVMKEVAPEIPVATKKAVKTLDEVVLTLKAMQKTWFLRSNVEDVKEEQLEMQKRMEMRQPASQ